MVSDDRCHCGEPAITHADGFTRGLCAGCDAVRCDAYPGECMPPVTYDQRTLDAAEQVVRDLAYKARWAQDSARLKRAADAIHALGVQNQEEDQ